MLDVWELSETNNCTTHAVASYPIKSSGVFSVGGYNTEVAIAYMSDGVPVVASISISNMLE